MTGSLLAVSDLHVSYDDNRMLVERLRPSDEGDWLIVAGDVGQTFASVESTLSLLAGRFARVIWTPGNHELWTSPNDPERSRGVQRYQRLARMCRDLGVTTPEDEYPVWRGTDGPLTVAPLFLLYDYSFRVPGASSKEESLARAIEAGIVCADESFLDPEPHASREEWCWARVEWTRRRLAERSGPDPMVLINHFPLTREPTQVLWYPEFAQWCGTELTSDWHVRFGASVVVYGHLHIPRSTVRDGVRFEEVSLGYPREWRRRGQPPDVPRLIAS